MKNPRWIAVLGGSGSGKTWLAEDLQRQLGEQAGILSLDFFYRDLAHLTEVQRGEVNFDDPAAIDWEALRQVMDSIESNGVAEIPVYDFSTHLRKAELVQFVKKPIIFLEGLWLLHHEWLRNRFEFRIFIDCSEETRLARRLHRDVLTRGRTEESVNKQFFEQVQPMHERFIEPQKQWATHCLTSPLSSLEVEALLQCFKSDIF